MTSLSLLVGTTVHQQQVENVFDIYHPRNVGHKLFQLESKCELIPKGVGVGSARLPPLLVLSYA